MQKLIRSASLNARRHTVLAHGAALLLLAGLAACGDSPAEPVRGSLAVEISGVPAGTLVSVTVTGAGFSRVVTASETLSDLVPGTYTLTAGAITRDGVRYSPSNATQTVTVTGGNVAASASVTFAVSSGALAVTIGGIPGEALPLVLVTGPNAFSTQLSTSTTLLTLEPGLYTLTAQEIVAAHGTYVPLSASQQIQVGASITPAVATVSYGITTGAISLTISGLPTGVSPAITLVGPNGYTRQLTESGVIANLAPGSYTLSTGSAQAADGHVYSASPVSQGLTIQASETPKTITVNYRLATGALDVSVTGLPAGANASVSVTGPNGYSRNVTGSVSLTGLFPGTYLVSAANVNASAVIYTPTPAITSHDVTATLTPRQANIAYFATGGPPPPAFNLTIDGLHVTQVVQTFAGDVPLVAGRPGLLRVFVRSSTAYAAQPSVRVRFYNSGTLTQTIFLSAPSTSVPTAISEGTLASSWNAIVPASLIQPGFQVLADVDPTNTIQEANEGDNSFPGSGSPAAQPVRVTPPLNVWFVPVQHGSNGATGNVTEQNMDQYLVMARKVLPIKDIVPRLHAVFSTSAPTVESNDATGAWITILLEIEALRVAEGSADYHMGVVNAPYASGIAGYGFAPGRATVTWDRLPAASPVAAHELGHNLGRSHAPCGGAANVDPFYPYVLGTIGVYGYDISLDQLKGTSTTDLMGYCGFGWISDYNYVGMMNYRTQTPGASVAPNVSSTASGLHGQSPVRETTIQSSGARPSLVVWGRIDNGRPVLEPAFAAVTRPVLPARSGPHRVEALDGGGRVLFSYAFEGDQPADAGAVRTFAFAVPLDSAASESIAVLRLTSATGARAEFRPSGPTVGGPTAFEAITSRPGEVSFTVRDPAVRLAVVRDRASRQIVAFVRGGSKVVRSRAVDFEVELSDGRRSVRRVLRAVPR